MLEPMVGMFRGLRDTILGSKSVKNVIWSRNSPIPKTIARARK